MNCVNMNEYFIAVIRAAIHNEKAPEPAETIELDKLLELARIHSLEAIFTDKLSECENISEELKKSLRKKDSFYRFYNERQMAEMDYLSKVFDEKGIRYMPMKGIVSKPLYVKEYYRQMGDIDILFHEDDIDRAENILEELKYTITRTPTHHDECSSGKYSNLELHRRLVGNSVAKFEKYYHDSWKFAKPDVGSRYKMSDEDFYIFILTHLAKHFINGGIGVKAVMDVYVYLDNYKDTLDWDYIRTETDTLEIGLFCKNIELLAEYWFGSSDADDIIKRLGEYIIACGSFGTQANREQYKLATQSRKIKNKYLLRIYSIFTSAFPPYRIMVQRYEGLGKRPYLLPYYWGVRIVNSFKDKKTYKRIAKTTGTSSQENEAYNDFYKNIGL